MTRPLNRTVRRQKDNDMKHIHQNPAAAATTENAWLTSTTRFLDLGTGCWIVIEDDPNSMGCYVATTRVDDMEHTIYEAVESQP